MKYNLAAMKCPYELKVIKQILAKIFSLVDKAFISTKANFSFKKNQTIITPTDLAVNKLITQTIYKYFPKDAILSEEMPIRENKGNSRLWIIDPICGTSNLAAGINFFCTNICLFDQQKPVFALVIDYYAKTYYWASQNYKGIYDKDQPLLSSINPDRKNCITIDPGYLFIENAQKTNNFANIMAELSKQHYYLFAHSSSLDFIYTVLGKTAGVIACDMKSWDIVASCYLMEKNGGLVTDFSGKPWGLTTKNFVASLDKKIHQNLLSIVQKNY